MIFKSSLSLLLNILFEDVKIVMLLHSFNGLCRFVFSLHEMFLRVGCVSSKELKRLAGVQVPIKSVRCAVHLGNLHGMIRSRGSSTAL